MKVIFMGTPSYADAILKALIKDDNIDVVAVYTQPDKPVGRKKILTPPPVKMTAEEYNIVCYQPTTLRDETVIELLGSIECDYIVVAAYGQILPKQILQHAPCINLHASILPQYRGASPIQQTLLNGDKETGVSAMLMDEGLDTGDIITIKKIAVDANEMLETLFQRLTQVAVEVTLDVVKNFQQYTPKKQDESLASYCKKITKDDGKIVWDDALTIYNKYRAFTPWPGVYTQSGLKMKAVQLVDTQTRNDAGKILAFEKDGIIVGCKTGALKITKLQPPSKKEMDALAYCNGKRLQVEDTLF